MCRFWDFWCLLFGGNIQMWLESQMKVWTLKKLIFRWSNIVCTLQLSTKIFLSDIQPTVEESLKKGRRESRPPRFYFLPSLFWTLWPTPLAICFDYTWNCQFATPKAQFPSFFSIAKSLKNKRKIHFRVKLSLHT